MRNTSEKLPLSIPSLIPKTNDGQYGIILINNKLINAQEFEKMKEQLTRINNGENFNGVHYEQIFRNTFEIGGHSFQYTSHTAKINDEKRFVCLQFSIGNKRVLLAWKAIRHNYNHPCLTDYSISKNHIEKSITEIQFHLGIGDIVPDTMRYTIYFKLQEELIKKAEENPQKVFDATPVAQETYNLSEDQMRAVYAVTPAFYHGIAGVGKTHVGIRVYKQHIEKHLDSKLPCLVIVYTPAMKVSLKKFCTEQKIPLDRLEILCYQDFTFLSISKEKGIPLEDVKKIYRLLTPEILYNWCHESGTALSNRFKEWKESPCHRAMGRKPDMNSLFDALDAMAGFSREEFLNQGARQTPYQDKSFRELLYDMCERIRIRCQAENVIEPGYKTHLDSCFDVVIVDEYQNLNLQKLLNLFHSAKNYNIGYAGDSNQMTHSNFNLLPNLSMRIRKITDREPSMVELVESFRSSPEVVEYINHCLELKHWICKLSNKKESKNVVPAGKWPTGSGKVSQIYGKNQFQICLPMIQQMLKQNFTEVALVVPNEATRAAMSKHFNENLIYTPWEIGGLEFKYVLVMDFISDKLPAAKEANQWIVDHSEEALGFSHGNIHRPKRDEQVSSDLKLFMSYLYIAISRAIHEVIIVTSEDVLRLHNLAQSFKLKGHPNTLETWVPNIAWKEASSDSREKFYAMLIHNGGVERARKLFLDHEGNEEAFDVLYHKVTKDVDAAPENPVKSIVINRENTPVIIEKNKNGNLFFSKNKTEKPLADKIQEEDNHRIVCRLVSDNLEKMDPIKFCRFIMFELKRESLENPDVLNMLKKFVLEKGAKYLFTKYSRETASAKNKGPKKSRKKPNQQKSNDLMNLFELLTGFDAGCELLIKVYSSIQWKPWMTKQTLFDVSKTGTSIFNKLCLTSSGHTLLLLILKNENELIKHINSEILYETQVSASQPVAPLHALACSLQGQSCIYRIFKLNVAVCRDMKRLAEPLNLENNFVYMLGYTKIGFSIMEQIRNHWKEFACKFDIGPVTASNAFITFLDFASTPIQKIRVLISLDKLNYYDHDSIWDFMLFYPGTRQYLSTMIPEIAKSFHKNNLAMLLFKGNHAIFSEAFRRELFCTDSGNKILSALSENSDMFGNMISLIRQLMTGKPVKESIENAILNTADKIQKITADTAESFFAEHGYEDTQLISPKVSDEKKLSVKQEDYVIRLLDTKNFTTGSIEKALEFSTINTLMFHSFSSPDKSGCMLAEILNNLDFYKIFRDTIVAKPELLQNLEPKAIANFYITNEILWGNSESTASEFLGLIVKYYWQTKKVFFDSAGETTLFSTILENRALYNSFCKNILKDKEFLKKILVPQVRMLLKTTYELTEIESCEEKDINISKLIGFLLEKNYLPGKDLFYEFPSLPPVDKENAYGLISTSVFEVLLQKHSNLNMLRGYLNRCGKKGVLNTRVGQYIKPGYFNPERIHFLLLATTDSYEGHRFLYTILKLQWIPNQAFNRWIFHFASPENAKLYFCNLMSSVFGFQCIQFIFHNNPALLSRLNKAILTKDIGGFTSLDVIRFMKDDVLLDTVNNMPGNFTFLGGEEETQMRMQSLYQHWIEFADLYRGKILVDVSFGDIKFKKPIIAELSSSKTLLMELFMILESSADLPSNIFYEDFLDDSEKDSAVYNDFFPSLLFNSEEGQKVLTVLNEESRDFYKGFLKTISIFTQYYITQSDTNSDADAELISPEKVVKLCELYLNLPVLGGSDFALTVIQYLLSDLKNEDVLYQEFRMGANPRMTIFIWLYEHEWGTNFMEDYYAHSEATTNKDIPEMSSCINPLQ